MVRGVEAVPGAIRVNGLSRSFGGITAVDSLDFEVAHGELFGLVGPDGAGKTTTLRMLAGVLRPTSGDAEIAGISIVRQPERVKHQLAYMPQRFRLYGDLTVVENLHFYADLYRVPKAERDQRLERLFAFSNLGPFRDRLAADLSGGMKQKLGLSCALVHRPDVLLLDEPTFGVDPVSRRDLWLIVHEMVAEGVTAVVSTAYMDEAERFDRVALLHRGRLLALDTPQELQQTIRGELLEVRIEQVRQARAVVRSLPAVRRAAVFGDRLHLTVSSVARETPVVQAALHAAGLTALGMQPIAPSLEDVFIDRVAAAEEA